MIYLNPKDMPRPSDKKVEETPKERYTVPELKAMCKDKGITGYSKLKEEELIELLGL